VLLSGDRLSFDMVEALHGSPELRDRVLLVISLGADFGSDGRREWMAEHFTHVAMDTEVNRRTPYMAVIDVDPVDPVPCWADQRFPVPEVPPSGWAPLEPIDLGPMPLAAQQPGLLARALWVLLCFRLASR
jgi:hypothetical protein